MIAWRWVRGLRWWWQTLIGVLGVPLILVLLYVAVRSAQYLVADGDAGRFTPEAHAIVRLRDLDRHLDRLEASFAWTQIERKLLRDPAIRPKLNAALKGNGLPTLDDLQDPRKSGQLSRANLSRFAGRDVVVGLNGPGAFCAATRLGWLEYLGVPFAPLALKRDGDTLRAGKKLWVAFSGAIAVAGNDKALIDDALRGRGRPPEGTRPVEAVVRFEGFFAKLRTTLSELNLLPHLKVETAQGLRMSADLDGSAARIEAVLEGVENAYPGQSPPAELLARAPGWTTGTFVSTASFREIYAWAGGQGKTARELMDQLERGKLTEVLLPLLDPGFVVLTGSAESEGKVYPAFTLMVRSSDPKRAVEALTNVVKKIGGKFAESKFDREVLGDSEVFWMDPPDAARIDDFLMPTWGAVEGGLVFGNNLVFTKSVMGAGGELWKDRRIAKRLAQRLKDLGFAARPGLAGGVLVPPLLRESLDGVIQYLSRVMAVPSDALLRQALEREWAEQGRGAMPEDEKGRLFLEAREAKIQEYEAELRRGLRGLEPVRWCAFESGEVSGGASLKVAIGFDNLTDR